MNNSNIQNCARVFVFRGGGGGMHMCVFARICASALACVWINVCVCGGGYGCKSMCVRSVFVRVLV